MGFGTPVGTVVGATVDVGVAVGAPGAVVGVAVANAVGTAVGAGGAPAEEARKTIGTNALKVAAGPFSWALSPPFGTLLANVGLSPTRNE